MCIPCVMCGACMERCEDGDAAKGVCPECGREVPPDAFSCPSCYTFIPRAQAQGSPAKDARQTRPETQQQLSAASPPRGR